VVRSLETGLHRNACPGPRCIGSFVVEIGSGRSRSAHEFNPWVGTRPSDRLRVVSFVEPRSPATLKASEWVTVLLIFFPVAETVDLRKGFSLWFGV